MVTDPFSGLHPVALKLKKGRSIEMLCAGGIDQTGQCDEARAPVNLGLMSSCLHRNTRVVGLGGSQLHLMRGPDP